jgi:hypothetical protein
VTHSENLIKLLHHAFDYTQNNNRDLIELEMFPITEVVEELEVQRSYQFLIAYIRRNSAMINTQMED